MVTDDSLADFLYCKRKAYLRAAGKSGQQTDYERVFLDAENIYRQRALDVFLASLSEQAAPRNPLSLGVAMKSRLKVPGNL
jgi:hypothetical protein